MASKDENERDGLDGLNEAIDDPVRCRPIVAWCKMFYLRRTGAEADSTRKAGFSGCCRSGCPGVDRKSVCG